MAFKDEIKPASVKAGVYGFLSEATGSIIAGMKEPLEVFRSTNQQDLVEGKVNLYYVFQPYIEHPFKTMLNGMSTDLFWNIQPICVGIAAAAATWHMIDKMTKDKLEDAAEHGAHGTSRWAKLDEILKSNDITNEAEDAHMILGMQSKFFNRRNTVFYLSNESRRNRHVAIIGGSGAGKSRGFMIPNILHINDASLVVTDPKGELYEATSEAKRKQGYKVRLINFKELAQSDRYNPLDYIHEDIDAKLVADAIISNSSLGAKREMTFWDKAELSLLSCFLIYAKEELPEPQKSMASVFELVTSETNYIHYLFRSLPDGSIAKRAYKQAMSKLKGKTEGDVFQTLSATLDLWKYDTVNKFTYTSDFNFADLAKEKTILYVILPVADKNMRPLIGTFFSQMLQELYRVADHNFNKLPVPVELLLEEFNNIGKIPNFEEIQSTSRGYGIGIKMVIQSVEQLKDRWGDKVASELLTNCDTTLYLGSNDKDGNKYFSDLLGPTTKKVSTRSKSKNDKGTSSGENYTYIGRPLQTPDELRRMKDHEAILFIKGNFPIKLKKAWYDKLPAINEQVGEEVSRFDYAIADRSHYDVFVPEDRIRKLVELNDGNPLDIAQFTAHRSLIIDTNDPAYHLEKAAEEKAEKIKQQEAKKALKEEKAKNKETKKSKPDAEPTKENDLPPIQEPAFNFTDADAPPEDIGEILPHHEADPFPSEHLLEEKPVKKKKKRETIPADADEMDNI
ncbi:type IV secretory system conjugative DNA transfer family protein [Priestia aryabhattai]|uniref:VirD4-like conjugal transfer protein, CD1115 family n=1 Tax=Priestia aryabhattai TaxID=412384 RepID=UPI001C8E17A3|nr:type IV secretory system conjugative DNA transfer family protein [Priestia aryabhattai]MBY0077963.1 type IV secretory system conjugative DNA transfer family protein [Priestia aryabhattai]